MLVLPNFKKDPISLDHPYHYKNPGKVREFDPKAYEPMGHTKDHDIYYCPFCEEVRGRPDRDGKFYWNYRKQVGFCFKCETVGILHTDKPAHLVLLENTISSIINSFSTESSIIENELNTMRPINYGSMFKELDQTGLSYIDNRNCFYPEVYKAFNMMSAKTMGMTVPVIINGQVYSYCLRFYHPKGHRKYYLPETHKLLYSPTQKINLGSHLSEITLVEGTFDAIACEIDGFKNPIAIFGKAITPLQLYLLRSLSPDHIRIYLDETKLSVKLLRHLRGMLPTVSRFSIVHSDGSDSEEKLNWKIMNYSEDYIESLIKNVEEINEYCSQEGMVKVYG